MYLLDGLIISAILLIKNYAMNIPNTAKHFITLNRHDTLPLHNQIYVRFKDAITQGLLKAGQRVPSSRNLASELNVARGTVDVAYEMLYGEGFLIAKGQAGTYVAPNIKQYSLKRLSPIPSPLVTTASASNHPSSSLLIFHPCTPAFDAFPRKLWARLGARRLRTMLPAELATPDPLGYAPLRQAIASYLQISRGIACSANQIFITRAYQGGLDLISRALLSRGDQVWMEDPGYPAARNLLAEAGGEIISVPVNGEGLQVDIGITKAPHAKFAVVTPSHQSPTGVPLSLSRRLELLEWAKKANAWIIEDDYDGEYRYVGHPLPALKSLDTHDRVLYAGTFSKVLCPSLRLGYVVVPQSQVTRFEQTARIFQSGCSQLTQGIVTDFMVEGYFSRHLKKMRTLYSKRRKIAIAALIKTFGDNISIELQMSGMHLLVRTNWGQSDKEIARLLSEHGFGIHALSDWSIESNEQGLLLGFTNIESAESAEYSTIKMKSILSIKYW